MLPSSVYGQLSDPLVQAAAAALASAGTDSVIGSRDTMFTKIFVGGLPYHTSDKTLHEYFEQFGDIEEAVVITDRQTQKSRGYGFVTMKDRAAAERACKDPNPIIDGRKANVNLAYLGAKPRTNVQLAALANQVQLPLQTQLQALFPTRIGLPQLYYPSAGLVNPLLGAAAAQSQGAVDYTALAAAVANGQGAGAAYAIPQAGSRFQGECFQAAQAAGLDPYGYAAAGYGIVPGTYQLQSAQLAAAQQQLEHQRV
ncbi:hypothetical protein NECAME_01967 [Necator americanus]|uniref:RRM domain-containing protein n=1 Tax=Necator americanus TaxID=51031 RepID=W2TNU0_NECAM|nr:hypothetical protein NECAME_01967 [Necator americanus]ETN82682.1 hypothetical protein NECAME_01967 [Necator americanus]